MGGMGGNGGKRGGVGGGGDGGIAGIAHGIWVVEGCVRMRLRKMGGKWGELEKMGGKSEKNETKYPFFTVPCSPFSGGRRPSAQFPL